jgi:competence protein ComEA
MLKRKMWVSICILMIGLLMVPGFIVAGDKVNINTANKDELCALKGVGPAIAVRIIEYREKNGKFKTIEEITEVKGIGDATFEKIKDLIVVE